MLKIEKLPSDNFHSWKQKVKLVLEYRDLDSRIYPTVKKPVYDADAEIWSRNDRKYMEIIGLSISDAHLNQIDSLQTAERIWRSLLDIFERHTLLNQLTTRRRFYNSTMYDTETILTYTNRINHLAATISAMGLVVEDQKMAMEALNGLSDRFYYLISAPDTLVADEKDISLDFVKGRLIQEEQRFALRYKSPQVPSDATARMDDKAQSFGVPSVHSVTIWVILKPGASKRTLPLLLPDGSLPDCQRTCTHLPLPCPNLPKRKTIYDY